ncbi:MAG: hypothetical protein LBD23_03200 [Oscillospiraceae bacterium]|jgi:hypothetical protein|nr:hypothetical protein [Oscillospiraceae bacterium]
MRLITIIILIIVCTCLTIAIYKFGLVSLAVKNITIGIIILLGFILFIIPFLLTIFIGLQTSPAPPIPEITYGEFPFRLEYEMDGEHYIIEDTLIAEFNRSIEGNATTWARRIWDSKLESGNELRTYVLKEMTNVWITFHPGFAEYYMGDPHGGNVETQNSSRLFQPQIVIRTVDTNGRVNLNSIWIEDAHEILEKHGILLVSWNLAEPIINSFS